MGGKGRGLFRVKGTFYCTIFILIDTQNLLEDAFERLRLPCSILDRSPIKQFCVFISANDVGNTAKMGGSSLYGKICFTLR